MITIIRDDCRRAIRGLEPKRFRCAVSSPPYFRQRAYLADDHPDKALEIGREPTPDAYIAALIDVFREVRRVLTDDGTLWINLGSSYARKARSGTLVGSTLGGSQSAQLAYRGAMPGKTAKIAATQSGKQGRGQGLPPGFKNKDLIPLPWMLGIALQPTQAHEYVLLLSQGPRYFYGTDSVRQPHRTLPSRQKNTHKAAWERSGQVKQTKSGEHYHPAGRNLRSVWDDINTEPGDGQHVAPMPRALARRCILAGSAIGDEVLDPFGGRGTVGAVAEEEGRHATLVELDERAVAYARTYTAQTGLLGTGAR